jgi:hypothetical protein
MPVHKQKPCQWGACPEQAPMAVTHCVQHKCDTRLAVLAYMAGVTYTHKQPPGLHMAHTCTCAWLYMQHTCAGQLYSYMACTNWRTVRHMSGCSTQGDTIQDHPDAVAQTPHLHLELYTPVGYPTQKLLMYTGADKDTLGIAAGMDIPAHLHKLNSAARHSTHNGPLAIYQVSKAGLHGSSSSPRCSSFSTQGIRTTSLHSLRTPSIHAAATLSRQAVGAVLPLVAALAPAEELVLRQHNQPPACPHEPHTRATAQTGAAAHQPCQLGPQTHKPCCLYRQHHQQWCFGADPLLLHCSIHHTCIAPCVIPWGASTHGWTPGPAACPSIGCKCTPWYKTARLLLHREALALLAAGSHPRASCHQDQAPGTGLGHG